MRTQKEMDNTGASRASIIMKAGACGKLTYLIKYSLTEMTAF